MNRIELDENVLEARTIEDALSLLRFVLTAHWLVVMVCFRPLI